MPVGQGGGGAGGLPLPANTKGGRSGKHCSAHWQQKQLHTIPEGDDDKGSPPAPPPPWPSGARVFSHFPSSLEKHQGQTVKDDQTSKPARGWLCSGLPWLRQLVSEGVQWGRQRQLASHLMAGQSSTAAPPKLATCCDSTARSAHRSGLLSIAVGRAYSFTLFIENGCLWWLQQWCIANRTDCAALLVHLFKKKENLKFMGIFFPYCKQRSRDFNHSVDVSPIVPL